MPYIKQEQRDRVDKQIEELLISLKFSVCDEPENLEGVMNYTITKLVHEFYGSNEFNTNYKKISKATGMLENVKQEYYRKVASPYEDLAEKRNGKV